MFTVKFNFDDLLSVAKSIPFCSDIQKTEFIKQLQENSNDTFNKLFSTNVDEAVIIEGRYVYRNWFDSRKHIILTHDSDSLLLYCVYCMSFANKDFSLSKGLQINNLKRKYVSQVLERHDKCTHHQKSVDKFKSILTSNNTNINNNVPGALSVCENRYLLKQVTRALIYVTTSGLPIRSSSSDYIKNLNLSEENLYIRQTGVGHVFSQLKLLCVGDKLLHEYMLKVQEYMLDKVHTTKTSFVSFGIWKKILCELKIYIINKIVCDIKANGGKFGVEIDSTTDVAGKHQVSVVLKYVTEEKNAHEEIIYVGNEHTVVFKPVKRLTAANVFNFLRCSLEDIGLDISNISGMKHF